MKQPPVWDDQDSNFPPPSHPIFQGPRESEERHATGRLYSGAYRPVERRWPLPGRSLPSRWDGPWSLHRNYKQYDEYEENESNRIVAQVIGAAVLVLVTYAIFQSSHPVAQRAQQAVRTVMTQETDFSAVSSWMAAHFGDVRLAVPALTNGSKSPAEEASYAEPLADYKVEKGFDPDNHPAVTLRTAPGSEVRTVAKGQVQTFDKNDRYGIYVIVDHGGSLGQTLYGHLDAVTVRPGDWLYTGQTIGKTGNREPSDLYFAHFVKNKPVDPRDLLTRVRRSP